jgi:ABC-2 type transport system ATP-binding protein
VSFGFFVVYNSDAMIELDHVEKIIDKRTVLAIPSWRVAAGEIATVVGPVGSGKTTLLQLLAGETAPSGGTVRVAGHDPQRGRAALGLVWTDDLLYPRGTARENVLFQAQIRGIPAARVDQVLASVHLADQAHIITKNLAEPQKRRLALARALVHQPPVLLCDELELRADRETRELFIRVLRDYAAATPAACVLTTSDPLWGAQVGTRLYDLQGGRIVAIATPEPDAEPPGQPFKIPARKADRVVLYNPADVLYATSRDGKTYVHTMDDSAVSNLTLLELEERLARSGFFKAHRAYLVNLQRIREVVPFTKDSFLLILDDPERTQVPLSKQAARELQDLLGY